MMPRFDLEELFPLFVLPGGVGPVSAPPPGRDGLVGEQSVPVGDDLVSRLAGANFNPVIRQIHLPGPFLLLPEKSPGPGGKPSFSEIVRIKSNKGAIIKVNRLR